MRFPRMTAPLAAMAFVAGVSPAGASVPLGHVAKAPTGDCAANYDFIQSSVAGGNSYTVPATGTITSWSSSAGVGAGPGAQYTIKVFRQVAGLTYSVVGHDGPRPLAPTGVSRFASNLSVKPGDLLGIHTSTTGTNCTGAVTGLSADTLLFRGMSNLADGSSGTFAAENDKVRLNIAAELVPTNSFNLSAIQRNKKKGRATLTVDVPNPGELTATGKGVKAAVAAGTSTSVFPGEARITMGAKGKKLKKLKKKGKVKLTPTITYTPTGGDPSAQSLKVKLRKR